MGLCQLPLSAATSVELRRRKHTKYATLRREKHERSKASGAACFIAACSMSMLFSSRVGAAAPGRPVGSFNSPLAHFYYYYYCCYYIYIYICNDNKHDNTATTTTNNNNSSSRWYTLQSELEIKLKRKEKLATPHENPEQAKRLNRVPCVRKA